MKNMRKLFGTFTTVVLTLVMVLGLSSNAFAASKASDGKTLQFGISILGEQPENGTSQYLAKDYLHLNTSTFKFDCKLTVCEEVHNTEIGSSYSNDEILARLEGYVPTLEDFINYPAKGEKGLATRDIYLQNKDTFLQDYYIRWYVLKLSGGKWKIDGVVEKKPVAVVETVEEEPVVEEVEVAEAEAEAPVAEEAPAVEEVKAEAPVVEEAPAVEEPKAEEVKAEAPVAEVKNETIVENKEVVENAPATVENVAVAEEAPVVEEEPATVGEESAVYGVSYLNPELTKASETGVVAIEENKVATELVAANEEAAVLGVSYTENKTANVAPVVTVAALMAMSTLVIILFAKRRKDKEEEK